MGRSRQTGGSRLTWRWLRERSDWFDAEAVVIAPKALPRAPQKNLPLAIEAFEGAVELNPGELSPERLKAYRRPNRAVLVNSTVDVGRAALKRCST